MDINLGQTPAKLVSNVNKVHPYFADAGDKFPIKFNESKVSSTPNYKDGFYKIHHISSFLPQYYIEVWKVFLDVIDINLNIDIQKEKPVRTMCVWP